MDRRAVSLLCHDRTARAVALLALGAAVAPAAAQQFQGTVAMRGAVYVFAQASDTLQDSWLEFDVARLGERPGVGTQEVTFEFGAGQFRTGAPGLGYLIIDWEQREATVVRPELRQYVTLPLPDPDEAPSDRQVELRPVGERELGGRRAVGYELRTDTSIVRYWIAQDVPNVARTFADMLANTGHLFQQNDLADRALRQVARLGLPVMTQTLTRSRYEVEEIVGVNRDAPPPDRFAIPDGYERATPPGG